jgi:DNA-binding MarR family transcriptional regulator
MSGTIARLWPRPAHRADQRRSAGRESRDSVSRAIEAGARRGDRTEWGASENNRRARFYRLTREGRKQLQVRTQDWEQTAATIRRFVAVKTEDLS